MAEIYKRVKRGNDILANINMPPINGYHLADILWNIEFYTRENGFRLRLDKANTYRVDEDNYLCPIITNEFEVGVLSATINARIPSEYFKDGYQDESVDFQVDKIFLY